MNNKPERMLLNLKGGQSVRLGGLTLLEVIAVGEPMLKATVSAQILKGDECCIFDHNSEDWNKVEYLDGIVIGMGDRLIIGTVEVLVTALSKKFGEIRLSIQSHDEETKKLIRNHKECQK